MGHQVCLSFWRSRAHFRLRAFLQALYPTFVVRHSVLRPISLVSICFVSTVILMGSYLVVPFTLLPHLATHPFATTLWLLIFIWCVTCAALSYVLTAFALPGRVPSTWRPLCWQTELCDAPGIPANPQTSTNTNLYPVPPPDVCAAGTSMLRPDGRFRFCLHCNVFKPDRAHHCSSCDECVLQMDHHCPFTGNSCIGLLNRKFFILFLYYATISCLLVAVLTPRSIASHLFSLDSAISARNLAWTVLLLLSYMLCALHAIALTPFCAFHTYLIIKNRTTIENQEQRQPAHIEVLRRMDKSWRQNWNATFGSIPWLWFVPVTYGCEYDITLWNSKLSHGNVSIIGDDCV